jgi:hypothetical protein
MAVQTPIPKDPIGENFPWRDWLQKLSNRVFGSMGSQDSHAVFITGGTIDGTPIGQNTPAAGSFTTLTVSDPTHSDIAWSAITHQPKIEVYDLGASIGLTATTALLAPASTASGSSGITYNSSTGVFTFAAAGSYSLALVVNAIASAANQYVYIYAENNFGSGWVANTNSGKYFVLPNGVATQIIYSQAVGRVAGQQVRYWIYSNNNKVILTTTTLPGITATVYVPAIRIQYS